MGFFDDLIPTRLKDEGDPFADLIPAAQTDGPPETSPPPVPRPDQAGSVAPPMQGFNALAQPDMPDVLPEVDVAGTRAVEIAPPKPAPARVPPSEALAARRTARITQLETYLADPELSPSLRQFYQAEMEKKRAADQDTAIPMTPEVQVLYDRLSTAQPPADTENYTPTGEAILTELGNTPERIEKGFLGNALQRAEQAVIDGLGAAGFAKNIEAELSEVRDQLAVAQRGLNSGAAMDMAPMLAEIRGLENREALLDRIATTPGHAEKLLEKAREKVLAAQRDRAGLQGSIDELEAAIKPTNAAPGWDQALVSGISSFGDMAPGFVTTVVTKNPIPMMAYLTAYSRGSTYVDKRAEGYDSQKSATAANLYAAAELTDVVPLSRILREGSGFLRKATEGALTEAPAEVLTQFLQQAVDTGFLKEDMTWGEAVAEMKQAGQAGLVMGGMMGATAGAVSSTRDALADRRARKGTPADPNAYSFPGQDKLTPEDKASPIPDDAIGPGKEVLDQIDANKNAPAQPSTPVIPGETGEVPTPDGRSDIRPLPLGPEQVVKPPLDTPPDVPEGAVPSDVLYPAPEAAQQVSGTADFQPSSADLAPDALDWAHRERESGGISSDGSSVHAIAHPEIHRLLTAVVSPMSDGDITFYQNAIDEAVDLGRTDIAEALLNRVYRAARRAGEATPGVDPSNPRYPLIQKSLADRAAKEQREADETLALYRQKLASRTPEAAPAPEAPPAAPPPPETPSAAPAPAESAPDAPAGSAPVESVPPAAVPVVESIPPGGGRAAAGAQRQVEELDAETVQGIETDAETFQYKAGGDTAGVTGALRGVEEWDNTRSGLGIIYEYANGRRVIVDGHQRLDLAKRLSAEGKAVNFPVRVLRESDGISESDARVIAANANISQGSGTALDAAKVFRETRKTARDLNLPVGPALVRDADAMAKLSNDAFGMVINDVASTRDAAAVGRLVQDQKRHADILGLLTRLKPANTTQAESIVRQATQAEVTETQTSLFGEEEVSANLYMERAKILDKALKDLGSDIRAFKTVIKRSETFADEGNVLKGEANAARLSSDEQARASLERQANTKGPISAALTEAARAYKETGKLSEAVESFTAAIRREEEVGGSGRPEDSPARDGDEQAQGGVDGPAAVRDGSPVRERTGTGNDRGTAQAEPTNVSAPAEGQNRRSPSGAGQDRAGAPTQDVAPSTDAKPTYINRPVANADAIIAWAGEQGFKTTLPASKLHVTITYSKEPVSRDDAAFKPRKGKIVAEGGRRSVEQLGDEGAVVLRFQSQELQDRAQQTRDAGASSDFPSYKPHVTITYDAGNIDLDQVEPYRGPIEFGPESVEDINPDAVDQIDEVATTQTERTPEGEQTLIPGTREDQGRDTSRDKAEVEARAKQSKKGTAVEQGNAGPLFGDEGGKQETLLDRAASVGRRPKGKLSPEFLDFSFTNRPSVFSHAFRAIGMDPDKAALLPLEHQIDGVKKVLKDKFGVTVEMPKIKVQKKNPFGRKVVAEQSSISPRMALDQMLNAYRQFQMLAHMMAIPESAVGLPIDGKGLTLNLVSRGKLQGALGQYTHGGGQRAITIPGMSNSFAHEWAHALDHYMALQVDPKRFQGLLTRDMDTKGVQPPLSPKRALTDAFAHILWSMYGDSSQIGALHLQLEVESAQVYPGGKPTPKAEKARKILTDMREGRRPPKEYLSKYFRTTKIYDDMVAGGGYFTDPAEMFARAFEAMIGNQVAQLSDQPQAFLTKGEWAYSDSGGAREALTFPKDIDGVQFARAMTNLQQAMSRISLFGPNAPAEAPATHDVMSTRDLLRDVEAGPVKNMLSKEFAAIQETAGTIARSPKNAREWGSAFMEGMDKVYSQAIRTGAATLFAIADRQTNPNAKKALMNIAKKVGKRPGRGMLTTSLWEENVRRKANQRINKIDGVLRRYKRFGKISKAEMERIRKLMTDQDVPSATSADIEAATALRQVMTEIWYDLQSAGIKVGYKSGYLPHIYDADKATANPDQFRAKAKEVYALMFDREVTSNVDADGQLQDMNAVIRGLRSATKALPTDEGRVPDNRLTEADEKLISDWQQARAALRDQERNLKDMKERAAARRDKGEDPLAAAAERQAEKEQLLEELSDAETQLHDDVLEMLNDRWSTLSAEQWLTGVRTGDLTDFGSIGPTGSFLKARVLPNEAGNIMREFMPDDLFGMLSKYSFDAAKKSEYAHAFGAENEKLLNLLYAADGASALDIAMVKQGVNAATGRIESANSGFQTFRTTSFTLGNLSMLSLASFSSLAEPLTAGLRSGQVRDSLRGVIEGMVGLVRGGRRRELMEISRTIGLIVPYTMDTLMQNRLGADVMGNHPKLQGIVGRFFIANGLTPLTHYQRAMMVPVANGVLLRHLRADVLGKRGTIVRDVVAGGKGRFSDGELNELGIAKDDRKDLLDWLEEVGGLPKPDDLFGPDGNMHKAAELWSRAVYRFSTETIQDPLKTDRTFLANHPDHSAMYGIMSFIDAFTRNVIFRNLERGMQDGDGVVKKGAKLTANAAMMMLPMGTLIMGQMLTGVVRELTTNSDKLLEMWDEDEEEAIAWLMERGFYRSGVFGRLDPLANLMTGVRYETDLTSAFSGPYVAYFAKNLQNVIAAYVGRNSENTNTAEHKAAASAYAAIVKPVAVSLIAAAGPAGPLSIWGTRAALFKTSSYNAQKDFADAIVGEKGSKNVGDPWWELGDMASGTSLFGRAMEASGLPKTIADALPERLTP